jgi:hypothetical protein
MKKFVTITLIAFVVALSVSSCKSHERCPAYGKVEHNAKKSI